MSMVVVKLGPGLQIPTHCVPGAHSWQTKRHTHRTGETERYLMKMNICHLVAQTIPRGHNQSRYYLNPPSFGGSTAYLSFLQRWMNLCGCTHSLCTFSLICCGAAGYLSLSFIPAHKPYFSPPCVMLCVELWWVSCVTDLITLTRQTKMKP